MSTNPTEPQQTRTPISQLWHTASYMGLVFGGYWVVKYLAILFIFSPYQPILSVLYLLLTLPVPFVAGFLTKKYRDKYRAEYEFSFSEAYLFGVLLYFFASLLVAVPHYYFYAYVLPQNIGFFEEYFLHNPNPELREALAPLGKNLIDQILQIEPIHKVFSEIMVNVVWGGIFSLVAALVLKRKAPITHR